MSSGLRIRRVWWIVVCVLAVGILAACVAAQRQGVRSGSGSDCFYPRLPSELRTAGGGNGLPLLARGGSLSGIVAWADKNLGEHSVQYHSVLSSRRGATCFVVLYDVGSGLHVWRYILYAQRVTSLASNEWQAAAVGAVGSSPDYDYVRCVYIDSGSRDLVFVGNDGRDIRRVRPPRSSWIR